MKRICYQKALLLIFIGAIFIQCRKAPIEKTELEKLPPITQNGANTFGCLINGKAFIPRDIYRQPTFRVEVDPYWYDGDFLVSASREEENSDIEAFAIASEKCKRTGTYYLDRPESFFSYLNSNPGCIYEISTPGTYVSGSFTITKYDLTQGIFSGTFDFTIYNKICGDTIHFSLGRFDKLL